MTPRERLARFYADFDAATAERRRPCGTCFRCCVGPPLYMTCSRLELELALDHARQRGWGRGLHFEPLTPERPDRRHAFRSWTCPFFSRQEGCTVYPHRPLACRVFGPFARQAIEWEDCAYRDSTQRYGEADELPLWESYRALMQEAGGPRGYVYPDQIQYAQPTVELLLGHESPTAPMRSLRFTLRPPERPTR